MKAAISVLMPQTPTGASSFQPTLHSVTPITLMDEASLSNFVCALKERERELLDEKEGYEATLQELAEGYGDDAERNVAESKERAVLFYARIVRELPKVQTALFRATNDLKGVARNPRMVPYGICTEPECGNFIWRERLEALPHEPVCREHCECVGNGKAHRN